MTMTTSSGIRFWWFDVEHGDASHSEWYFETEDDLMRFIPDYVREESEWIGGEYEKDVLGFLAAGDLVQVTEFISNHLGKVMTWGEVLLQTHGRKDAEP